VNDLHCESLAIGQHGRQGVHEVANLVTELDVPLGIQSRGDGVPGVDERFAFRVIALAPGAGLPLAVSPNCANAANSDAVFRS
jgi:hypothetical protein